MSRLVPPPILAGSAGRILAAAVLLLGPARVHAQCADDVFSLGSAFEIAFPESYDPGFSPLVVIMAESATNVAVDLPVCGPGTVLPVAPGAPALFPVCAAAQQLGTGVRSDRMLSIVDLSPTAPRLRVVFKRSELGTVSDDAYLAIPTSQIGTVYNPFSYQGGPDPAHRGRFLAVIHDDGTFLLHSDCVGGAVGPIGPLMHGDTYQFLCAAAGEDGTGPPVFSPNGGRFGLITGSNNSRVQPAWASGDTLLEMAFPAPPDGAVPLDEYFVTEFNKQKEPAVPGDVVRIMNVDPVSPVTVTVAVAAGGLATPDPTVIACPVAPVFALAPAGWCDYNISGGARISSGGGRIRVAQYMRGSNLTNTGDPTMIQLLPTTSFACHHRFYQFGGFPFIPFWKNGSYINVVAPSAAIQTTLLDGTPLPAACVGGITPVALPGGTHSWALCRVPDTVPPDSGKEHVVDGRQLLPTGVVPVPVAVYVYGQRLTGAYGYPAGVRLPVN